VLRPALVGAVVAACAALAHGLAGGDVTPTAVLVVGAGAGFAARAVAGRRLSTGQLLGLLLLGQVALHLLAVAPAGHDLTMVLAHVTATLASLLVLRHAEDLWWWVADAVVGGLRTPGVVPVPGSARLLPATAVVRHGDRLAGRVGGRAPPRTG
jgi:hypothetical protein